MNNKICDHIFGQFIDSFRQHCCLYFEIRTQWYKSIIDKTNLILWNLKMKIISFGKVIFVFIMKFESNLLTIYVFAMLYKRNKGNKIFESFRNGWKFIQIVKNFIDFSNKFIYRKKVNQYAEWKNKWAEDSNQLYVLAHLLLSNIVTKPFISTRIVLYLVETLTMLDVIRWSIKRWIQKREKSKMIKKNAPKYSMVVKYVDWMHMLWRKKVFMQRDGFLVFDFDFSFEIDWSFA
jgi:hypothetical protein